jgi:hypothetical protein
VIDRFLELIGKLPTTQSRVIVTLGAFLLTTLRYVASNLSVAGMTVPPWRPSYEWLGFLAVMSGLDVGAFMAKRTTDASYVAAKTGAPPTLGKSPTPENAP